MILYIRTTRFEGAITAAWEAVEEDYFEELLSTMQARCQAVIDADGKQTPW